MNTKAPFTLRRRYLGSCIVMGGGLATAVVGHLQSAVFTAPVGELMLYGGLLYHARKRQRFEGKRIWPALELYAGLSLTWMIVNIVRIRIWQWRPLAFGLFPALALAAYAVARLGTRAEGEGTGSDGFSTKGSGLGRVPLLFIILALWFFLNFYALPQLHMNT